MAGNNELDVIVIGAGSAGLLLCQGLKQHGIKCTVYEREDSTTYQTRPREWGMTLHWGDAFLAKCIPPDLREGLNKGICSDPFTKETAPLPNYNGKTGEKLFDITGTPSKRVSRRKIRKFLSQGLDIQYGKEISSITLDGNDKIVAHFEDGSSATGSILVGCDGSKSHVRTLLVGPEFGMPEDLDNSMFNVTSRFSAETALLLRKGHPATFVAYHPTNGTVWVCAIQDIPDPDRPETWLFQHILSWRHAPRPTDLPDQPSRLAHWRQLASDYAEPWRTVGREFPEDLPLRVDSITVWKPTMDWSGAFGGRVTLAGDGAHTMPPHRAQGLNNALQDAATLLDELVAVKEGRKGVGEALRAYEKEMKVRALREIPLSYATMDFGHRFDQLIQMPMFRIGIEKYREERGESGVEFAAVAQ